MHDAMLARYIMCGLSDCMAVRPSHAGIVWRMAENRITQTNAYDSSGTFLMPKISAKFQRGHPNGGAKIELG